MVIGDVALAGTTIVVLIVPAALAVVWPTDSPFTARATAELAGKPLPVRPRLPPALADAPLASWSEQEDGG